MKTNKTIIALLVTVAALVSCTKENIRQEPQNPLEDQQNIEVALNISYVDNTRAIQTDFMEGNTLYIFFNKDYISSSSTIESNWNAGKYLKMQYKEGVWVPANTEYLSDIPTTGTMDVIFLSVDGSGQYAFYGGVVIAPLPKETLPNSETAYHCYDALHCDGATYCISDGRLEGTVQLVRAKPDESEYPQIDLQISVKNIPSELSGHEWYLKTQKFTVKYVSYTNYDDGSKCFIRYDNEDSDKYCKCVDLDGDKVVYGGKNSSLDQDSNYLLTLYDKTANKSFTRTLNTANGSGSLYDLWNNRTNTAFAVDFYDFTRTDHLPGEFSVSSTTKIHFSIGNLVATIDASGAPTAWKFATNQYDCLGRAANESIGIKAGDIDLFGWSTAATVFGVDNSSTSAHYSGAFVDWGKNIDDKSTWRTLSKEEWQYLLGTSTERAGKFRHGVTVCGKTNCLVIAPDDFTGTIKDTYDATTWKSAEAAGLVCLPAAGYRSGSYAPEAGERGYYWSSSPAPVYEYAYYMYFDNKGVNYDDATRARGRSVRLVTDVPAE